MKIKISLLLFSLLLIAGTLSFANRDENMEPAEGFFLQKGNPVAGQKAFAELKCSSCHWVQNNVDLDTPVAAKLGPMLGSKQGGYPPGWIANSIVSPSHTIARNFEGEYEKGELSRMGDFSETMTVRQMMDLVAYIKSLGEKESSMSTSDERT